MNRVSLKHVVFVLAALSLTSAAFAQYVWMDEQGRKQYSDMPPPASVPKSRILKEPGGASRTARQSDAAGAENPENPASAGSGASREKAPMTTAERNAEFQKRRTEQAEKEKKAQEEALASAEKAKNCERARDYHRALESGERVVRTDRSGERQFLSDEQRAQEMNDARRMLAECK